MKIERVVLSLQESRKQAFKELVFMNESKTAIWERQIQMAQ